jgi:hypothetical protein
VHEFASERSRKSSLSARFCVGNAEASPSGAYHSLQVVSEDVTQADVQPR